MSNFKDFLMQKLAPIGVVVFSLAAAIFVILKFRAETGPGLAAAGPCMALACICQALRFWETNRSHAIQMLFSSILMVAMGVYFAVC